MARTFSVEDKSLTSSLIRATKRRDYSDIDLTFTARPSGDIYKKTDAAAVKQSVKNLITTNYYEKPFNPRFGANIVAMLFDLADEDAKYDVEQACKVAISRYEPRAEVLNIDAKVLPDYNSIEVSITFRVKSTFEEVTFQTILARLR